MNREMESLPSNFICKPRSASKGKKLRIFADDDRLVKHLNRESFELAGCEEEADVLWLSSHFKNFRELAENSPSVMINQFPNESVLTVKDLFAAAVQSFYREQNKELKEKLPYWFQTTYNLRTELPEFISHYQNRSKAGMDNHWIIKPWNLARGLDTYVTSDLAQIIRLIDSGPKIACKYLEDPVLFYREDVEGWVKFDLRFIVFLRFVEPLEAYVYNRFWLRFALKPFSLSECDDYEKHFTVFNYLDESKILQMECQTFIEKFENQNPDSKWAEVQEKVYQVFKEIFLVAAKEPSPRGIAHSPQSRAMYGVDMMLRWRECEGRREMQPVFLEMNFMPDCERACNYYPDFSNTVFETLFLEKEERNFVTKL